MSFSKTNSKTKIIVANWKMNPNCDQEAKNLFTQYLTQLDLATIKLIVAPPAIYLGLIADLNHDNKLSLSAQNIGWENCGAFTGQISAAMVKDIGCEYAMIGHSECRSYQKDTDRIIAKKFSIALANGLVPIVCVGETKQQFIRGLPTVRQALTKQLNFIDKYFANSANFANNHDIADQNILIAYEPVWAIGSGKTPSLKHIASVAKFIRQQLSVTIKNYNQVKILYGGSINPVNVQQILSVADIDGALVGGNSLRIDQFAGLLDSILMAL